MSRILSQEAAPVVSGLAGLAIAALGVVLGASDVATVEAAVTSVLAGLGTMLSGLITRGLVYSRQSYADATAGIPEPVREAIESAAMIAATAAVERAQRELSPGRP